MEDRARRLEAHIDDVLSFVRTLGMNGRDIRRFARGSVMRRLVYIAVAMMMLIPAAGAAQDFAMAGRWVVSFKVTKGNDKDRARIPQGITIECAQNTSKIICRALDNPGVEPFTGSADEHGVTFDVLSKSLLSTGAYGNCLFTGYTGLCFSGATSYQDRMAAHWVGTFVNEGLIEGQWTGTLFVGLGKYPVEGAWTAIRIP